MDVHTDKPCISCSKDFCEDRECPQWQAWFSQSWNTFIKQIQSSVWDEIDRRGKQSFCYYLPYELENPCSTCVCKDWCNTPCSQRWKWWDITVGKIRQQLKGRTKI